MVMLLFLLFQTLSTRAQQIQWNDFANRYRSGDLSDIRVTEDAIQARQKATQTDAETSEIFVRITSTSRGEWIKALRDLTGGNFREQPPNYLVQVLQFTIPLLLIIMIVWMLFMRGLRSAAGGPGGVLGTFGKSRPKHPARRGDRVAVKDAPGAAGGAGRGSRGHDRIDGSRAARELVVEVGEGGPGEPILVARRRHPGEAGGEEA